MTAAKIAITLPEEEMVRVRRAVRAGQAPSVSGYIAQVLAKHEQQESLQVLLKDLMAEHGRPTPKEVAWAKRALAQRPRQA